MDDFDKTLKRAIAGNADAMADLLSEFEPLIIRYATVNGVVNEDLRHHIIVNIIAGTRNFKEI